ncbi:GGDEF and EAL domain-containing protein [uncultured Sphingomonas sp.]|uniref:putative bifunctional diguanylate cyclase/phosphodiesterase n=1 Tax=uncultured Sphingomonas sp. TaxID=158754 RepID=UPI0025F16519|nr:GGDEF and EAL domain-containing protein [uncultured Sphingomonas sp.]
MPENIHDAEAARLDALRQLKLLDTPPSESFDRITRMAAQIFGLPIAAVSLTDNDRQWFKSRVGISHDHIARFKAPCADVAMTRELVVLSDLPNHPDYAGSRLAGDGVRFYAGAPLVTRDGYGLGALCVLGTEPREITDQEAASLRDLAAMVMSQIELQHAYGRVDPVTNLPNRVQFLEDLDDLGRDQGGERIAVLVDLAHAEEVSHLIRVMGAARLDDMIRGAARELRSALAGSVLYHVAATQFAFLAPPGAAMSDYLTLLRREIRAMGRRSSLRFVTTATVGVMPFTSGGTTPADVLRGAHSAAQDARDAGSELAVYSSQSDALYRRRLRLIEAFGRALESEDQLSLVFQPRINLSDGACIGVEALLRWRHPELGVISPAEFIPLIERTGLVRPAAEWVLDAALGRAGEWFRAGHRRVMSINISAANLSESDLVDRLKQHIARHGVPSRLVEVELTETAVMDEGSSAHDCLQAISDAGIGVAIDDFGTGYSSLAYLQRLPAKVIKIDQSFILNLDKDERDRALVVSMVRLSHELGYRVVAEGVETEEIGAWLRDIGCDEAQGFLYGRPMPAKQLHRMLIPVDQPDAGVIAA